MRVALIGFGNVGRAFARLVESKRESFPLIELRVRPEALGKTDLIATAQGTSNLLLLRLRGHLPSL